MFQSGIQWLRSKNIPVNGIVHLGANRCQENDEYLQYVTQNKILWVEALPHIVEYMRKTNPEINIIQVVLTDVDNQIVPFHVSSNDGLSSSIFDFHLHKISHPNIEMSATLQLKTSRFDTLVKNQNISANVLVLDLQGAELHCLRGMGELLKQFDVVCSEVNTGETYLKCDQLDDLETYLKQFNFVRHNIHIWSGHTYGDACYVKSL